MNAATPLRGLAALLLAFAAGCMTVTCSDKFGTVRIEAGRTPVSLVEIENSGWFVFGCLPLASGDPAHPNANTCRYFTNTVNLDSNLKVLHQEMEKAGVDTVANITSHWTDEAVFVLLLKRRAYHTSAVLLKSEKIP